MRILLLAPFGLGIRGTTSARALPLGQALAQRGHAVMLLIPPWDTPEDAGRTYQDAGVTVHHLPIADLRYPRASPRLLWRACRHIQTWNPDILHTFKPVGYGGAIGMWFMAQRWRPAIIFDLDDWEGRAGWAGRVSRWPGEALLREFQERWALAHADGVTAASRLLYSRAQTAGRPPHTLLHLPNGCPADGPAPFTPAWLERRARARQRWRLPAEGLIALWSTRFHEVELTHAARLFSTLCGALSHLTLLVAGAGLAGEERAWQELVQADDCLCRQSRYLGLLSPADWEDIVIASDLGLFPQDDTRINRARCPARLPRMMAVGLPVVASDVGEAGTYIIHGKSGWLVPSGDDAAFLEAVHESAVQPEVRRRMAERAAAQVRARFAWGRLAEGLEAFYREIWRRRSPRDNLTTSSDGRNR
ncbi:MAG: glycosyltransferase [Anaerolineae bacterium]